MNYLVTGGAGFIGSHLAEKLIAVGEDVYVLDDLSTGRLENLAAIEGNEKLHLTIASVMEEDVLEGLVKESDVVFHLAAAVGVRLIVESPVRTIETNISGTELVLKYANRYRKKVVLASTSEIYGKSTKAPFSEEDDMVLGSTMRSRWSYACSKAIDEFLALSYHREKKLPVIIARLFNTVGPRQVSHYGMVLPRFVRQALEGKPLTIYDDGRQSRSFCHVRDVVDAFMKLLNCAKAVGEVFNIGSNQEITIEELALKVKKLVNDEVEISYVPYTEAYGPGFEDMRRRVPDISKIKKFIDFKITKDIDEIILDVKDYFERAGREE
jgi:UDP-glucose 4-epimerase